MSEASALWYSSLDGLSLFARRLGAAARRAAVLCIHGLEATSRDLLPLASEIADTKRLVLVPDLRGHGRSDYAIDVGSYSVARLAEDAGALADVEAAGRLIVAGFGFGARIALRLAALRRDTVDGIILCAPDLYPHADPGIAAGTSGGEPRNTDWDPIAPAALAASAAQDDLARDLARLQSLPSLDIRADAAGPCDAVRHALPNSQLVTVNGSTGGAYSSQTFGAIKGFLAARP